MVLCPAAMKADRKRLKGEKTDLVNQMQQLYATLESREEQLRDFIRNYEQHRKVGTPPPNPDPADPRHRLPYYCPTQHRVRPRIPTQEDCPCPLMLTGGNP